MLRSIVRVLPVAVFVVLASGCGGGGSRSVPAPSGNPQQQPASVAGAVIDGVPASAARGIRVSVHLPLRNSAQLDTLVQSQGDVTLSMIALYKAIGGGWNTSHIPAV